MSAAATRIEDFLVTGEVCVRALDDAVLGAGCGRFGWDLQRRPDRYVSAALPELPFVNRQFDLVLCSNLLFSYDDRMDLSSHLAALREMLRVFPLLGYAGGRSTLVETVVTELRGRGVDVQLRPVPYAFQRGSHEGLRLSLTSAS